MNPWTLALPALLLGCIGVLVGWWRGRHEAPKGQPVDGPTARRLRVVRSDGPGDGPKEAA